MELRLLLESIFFLYYTEENSFTVLELELHQKYKISLTIGYILFRIWQGLIKYFIMKVKSKLYESYKV